MTTDKRGQVHGMHDTRGRPPPAAGPGVAEPVRDHLGLRDHLSSLTDGLLAPPADSAARGEERRQLPR